MYTVYVLFSSRCQRYYIGYTGNLPQRLEQHNKMNLSHRKSFTKKFGPWQLVYKEDGYKSRAMAMKREKEIKRLKSGDQFKALLCNGGVPHGD